MGRGEEVILWPPFPPFWPSARPPPFSHTHRINYEGETKRKRKKEERKVHSTQGSEGIQLLCFGRVVPIRPYVQCQSFSATAGGHQALPRTSISTLDAAASGRQEEQRGVRHFWRVAVRRRRTSTPKAGSVGPKRSPSVPSARRWFLLGAPRIGFQPGGVTVKPPTYAIRSPPCHGVRPDLR